MEKVTGESMDYAIPLFLATQVREYIEGDVNLYLTISRILPAHVACGKSARKGVHGAQGQ